MTADPKVSPRPWRVEDGCIVDAEGFLVVMVGPDDDALFSHIVRCVNAHDGLVEALREARYELRNELCDDLLARIDAALAAAKEGA